MSKDGNTSVPDISEEVLASLMTFRADSSNLPMTKDIELVARGTVAERVLEAETAGTPRVEPVEEETVTEVDIAEEVAVAEEELTEASKRLSLSIGAVLAPDFFVPEAVFLGICVFAP